MISIHKIGVLLVLLLFVATGPSLWGDCGSIPFDAPLGGEGVDMEEGAEDVVFDPMEVSVFEPQQRAIILWNGQEEILLLSTDQRATQRSSVLEVIPLPGRPEVRLGSFETFMKAQQLVVEKHMWKFASGSGEVAANVKAGRIDFQQKLGAHDLTVAEVLKPEAFTNFVQNYLHTRYGTERAPIRPEFIKIIQSYIDRDFRWFAFDVITLDEKLGSRDPIEYRFTSDHVFYPLRISTLEEGQTKVDLVVFTSAGASRFEELPAREVERMDTQNVSLTEIESLDPRWKGFFGDTVQVKMDKWAVRGKSSTLVSDIRVR